MNRGVALPGPAAIFWFAVLLLAAGGLQSSIASALSFRGGHPDFPLTVALSAALLSDASVGCLTGVAAGLVNGSIVGKTLGTYLVSRSVAGYLAGSVTSRLYRGNIGVVLLGVFIGSVVAEIVYGLSVPRLTLFHWIQATAIGAALNALLALPMTFLLRRFGWGQGRL